jgi:hypothetical protein
LGELTVHPRRATAAVIGTTVAAAWFVLTLALTPLLGRM